MTELERIHVIITAFWKMFKVENGRAASEHAWEHEILPLANEMAKAADGDPEMITLYRALVMAFTAYNERKRGVL